MMETGRQCSPPRHPSPGHFDPEEAMKIFLGRSGCFLVVRPSLIADLQNGVQWMAARPPQPPMTRRILWE